MTVAVAVRKEHRIILAAEGLVHFGGQRFPSDNTRSRKIHRIGDSVMAWAGWSLYAELLTAHLSTASSPPPLGSEAEVFSFFVQFWRAMQANYTYLQGSPEHGHPFANLDSTFLLANSSGIYRVAGDMDVTSFDQYSAIGSGSQYSLGALRVLYDSSSDPVDIAKRAIQVGIDFDVYCGGEIDLEEVAFVRAGARGTERPPG